MIIRRKSQGSSWLIFPPYISRYKVLSRATTLMYILGHVLRLDPNPFLLILLKIIGKMKVSVPTSYFLSNFPFIQAFKEFKMFHCFMFLFVNPISESTQRSSAVEATVQPCRGNTVGTTL
uniref:Uncharacterized protein n=1 Tax=Cacopsylla melanoneura TaxID=428564 RepID=A0A8D8RLN5_9HEMI